MVTAPRDNKIPAGYKQTEGGVIPNDWTVKALGEIATIATGNTPPTRNPQNYGEEFLFVSPVDLGAAKYITNTEKKLSKTGFAISRRFPKGSVLFVCIGSTIGKCGIAPIELTSNQQINAIFSSSAFSTEYVYYSVCLLAAKIRALAGEQAVPIVNKTQFGETVIPFPPLPEQRAIAAPLNDADTLIEELTKLIAKKRAVKQGAMQEFLTGKRRLPGLKGEWDAPVLGDLFTFKNGLNKSKKFFGYGTPIVNYMDVYKKRGITPQDLQGRVSLSKDELKAFQVRKGDVFFTRTSETAEEVGITSVMLDEPYDTVFSGFVLRARPKDSSLDDQFKKYCFSTSAVRTQITSQSTETTRALTNGRYLSAVSIARPPKPEQTAIAEVLSDMDSEIDMLEQRLTKYKQLKQGMMQVLLTGKIRLLTQ